MTYYSWFQLSLVCLLGAMSPGPSVALIINNTIKKNRLNGIITSIGHGLGVTFYALLAVIGLGVLIKNGPFFDVRKKTHNRAGWTGIEPATSCVTGRCSNLIELPPQLIF